MKSFNPTVAPRCQHTCNAVLLRVEDVEDVLFVLSAAAGDDGVGDAELMPHVSRHVMTTSPVLKL